MSIIIRNITSPDKIYDDTVEHDYEVKINKKHIIYFKHRRDEGLGLCLQRAGQAIIDAELPIVVPSFK